jgi:hypothetical protein
MYNSKITHSVVVGDSELSCWMKPIPTEAFRGVVIEEAAVIGRLVLGC